MNDNNFSFPYRNPAQRALTPVDPALEQNNMNGVGTRVGAQRQAPVQKPAAQPTQPKQWQKQDKYNLVDLRNNVDEGELASYVAALASKDPKYAPALQLAKKFQVEYGDGFFSLENWGAQKYETTSLFNQVIDILGHVPRYERRMFERDNLMIGPLGSVAVREDGAPGSWVAYTGADQQIPGSTQAKDRISTVSSTEDVVNTTSTNGKPKLIDNAETVTINKTPVQPAEQAQPTQPQTTGSNLAAPTSTSDAPQEQPKKLGFGTSYLRKLEEKRNIKGGEIRGGFLGLSSARRMAQKADRQFNKVAKFKDKAEKEAKTVSALKAQMQKVTNNEVAMTGKQVSRLKKDLKRAEKRYALFLDKANTRHKRAINKRTRMANSYERDYKRSQRLATKGVNAAEKFENVGAPSLLNAYDRRVRNSARRAETADGNITFNFKKKS